MQVPITWPLQVTFDGFGPTVSSDFESHLRRSKTPGVDIIYPDLRAGDDVVAVAPGVVTRAGTGTTGGFVELAHPGNLVTVYRHMRKVPVKKNQAVVTATPLGKLSFSPRDPEKVPHVHFEVRYAGRFLDPEALLNMIPPTRAGQKAQMVDVSALRAKLAKAKTYTTGQGAWIWILILLAWSHN